MTPCPNCGAPAEGRFCAACGHPLTGAAGSSPGNPAPELQENVVCALCYLLMGITGILFLLVEPYNRSRTVRFHAYQSIFFTVAAAVAWIVLGTVSTIIAQIPWVGAPIAALLLMALSLGVFGCWLYLMYKAYRGERFLLPVIGPFAEKQA